MNKLKCLKCGHEWMQRIEEVPKSCPHCKNRGWNKGPKTKTKIETMELKQTPNVLPIIKQTEKPKEEKIEGLVRIE